MAKRIEIGPKAKIEVRWVTNKLTSTEEEEKSIIALVAKKYGLPTTSVHVKKVRSADMAVNDGELAGDVVQDINDPMFQRELMKQWLKEAKIEDVKFDDLVVIDSSINALINYDTYGKGRRYTVKWIKWSNFLSYGPDNFFDFQSLHGLVLLNGTPANKSGKSTFAYDLLHFLLFGQTNTKKAKTMAELFNKYLPDEKNVKVEGCINIDGEDYIIRRTLTRPLKSKSKTVKVTNKVEYFKLAPDGSEVELKDTNEQGLTTTETSKIIKESIGNESDFDMIISANSKDLDSIIGLTETEKGRLLSRWIGLSVIEDKDAKARERWNKEISVGRLCDRYDRVTLETEVNELDESNKAMAIEIENSNKAISESETRIADHRKNRDVFLSSKVQVDPNLLRINVTSLEANIENITRNGIKRKGEYEALLEKVKGFGDTEYSEEEYRSLRLENDGLLSTMATERAHIRQLTDLNNSLAKAEYCPTCGRKFDNVDNSGKIAENEAEINSIKESGIKHKERSEEIKKAMEAIEVKMSEAKQKSQTELKAAAISTELANMRSELIEKKNLLKNIQANKEAIAKNGDIDAQINVIDSNISNEERNINNLRRTVADMEKEIARNTESIAQKKGYIVKIAEEQEQEKLWKVYLKMIGKDGISKMVLRNTLPIINSELKRLLQDATDFDVEVVMDENNNVDFIMIRDGVKTRLSAASGLETTQAALALRVVLGKMSRLSRPPFILLDEILGTVAKENYEDMKKIYDKVVAEYDFVLHICHVDLDWYDGNIVTVAKNGNISSISQ